MLLGSWIKANKLLVWGDHDVGYRFNVSGKTGIKIGTEKGGVSVRSVKIATELIGPPFGDLSIGPARFIFFSTNLIRNVNENSPGELIKLKNHQKEFLADSLSDFGSVLNFILVHDPTALVLDTSITRVLYERKTNISAIFHGHIHADWAATLLEVFDGGYKKLCKNFHVICVPSPWGMMGIGKGFKVLNLRDDADWNIEEHRF